MQDLTAGIILEAPAVAQTLGACLQRGGLRVVTVPSVDDALRSQAAISPQVWMLGVSEGQRARPQIGRLARNPSGEAVPVIAVLNEQPDSRRQALALGLSTYLSFPLDDEEAILVVRAVLGLPEASASKPITGDLSTVQLSELINMFYSDDRLVAIDLRTPTTSGRVLVQRGDIKDAHTASGAQGDEAVEEMLSWRDGSFAAEVGASAHPAMSSLPISAPPTSPSYAPIPSPTFASTPPATFASTPPATFASTPPATFASTPPATFASTPPATHASFGSTPPTPDTSQAPVVTEVAHELLAVLNSLFCYVVSFIEPAIAVRKLEATRAVVARRQVAVELFEVHEAGMVSLARSARDALQDVRQRDLVEATAEWILAFRMDLDQSYPGSIPFGVLRGVVDTASVRLQQLGLLTALGVES